MTAGRFVRGQRSTGRRLSERETLESVLNDRRSATSRITNHASRTTRFTGAEPFLTENSALTNSARPPNRDEAFVALGSNQGDRRAALHGAVRALERDRRTATGRCSSVRPSPVYESEAHTQRAGETQPAYLNAVVQLRRMTRSPEALLDLAQRLEADAGRDRAAEEKGGWQPRPLDVDLLVCGPIRRETERLRLPHPRLAERRFVLRPWADLAPNLRVPAPFDDPIHALLARCSDQAALRRTAIAL